MRTLAIIHSIGGFALGAAIVIYFSPNETSVWGNTFFGIPYSVALYAVPTLAALSAGGACWHVNHIFRDGSASVVIRSLVIACFAHIAYSVAHASAVVVAGLLHAKGPFEAILWGAILGLATLVLGSALVIPPGMVLSLLFGAVVPKNAP